MGLIGLFFNKSLLKLILLIATIFFALRITGWLVSLVAGLDPVILTVFLPILVAGYFVYRKKLWIWADSSSPHSMRRRYRRLSKYDLLPKGIELGHVVFSAGRRGFRVLKFIEIGGQQLHLEDKQLSFEKIHDGLAKSLSKQLAAIRRLGIEVSYELHCNDNAPQIILSFACEGRSYHECRANIDEFTDTLSRDLELSEPTTVSASIIDDNANAQAVLMMPLQTTIERLRKVEHDDHNAKLVPASDSDRPTKLRMIRLANLGSIDEDIEISLFDELTGAALVTPQLHNFSVMLHIKPIMNSTLNKELRETNKAYQSAMAQIVEHANDGLFSSKGQKKGFFPKLDPEVADATRAVKEVKTKFRRLEEAENSGYFEVSLALVGEPATAENMARRLKAKVSSHWPNARISIDRLPPTMVQAAVRRDLTPSPDRLSGNELVSLMVPQ